VGHEVEDQHSSHTQGHALGLTHDGSRIKTVLFVIELLVLFFLFFFRFRSLKNGPGSVLMARDFLDYFSDRTN
jgi:hypothetical protein